MLVSVDNQSVNQSIRHSLFLSMLTQQVVGLRIGACSSSSERVVASKGTKKDEMVSRADVED